MRTLVHLSDLHFGRVDAVLLQPLVEAAAGARPDVVVVSGDLTQRARAAEFEAARAFLQRLPAPQIVVPGNHDVPLYDVFSRFLRPLHGFRRYITRDEEPFYADDEIAVLGINTARSMVFKGGRINEEQIARVRERLCGLSQQVIKIVATHHPFDLPAGFDHRSLVGRAPRAMNAFAGCGVDLLLAGHMHVSHADSSAARYKTSGYSALVVQAGTATSVRGRGEANSFNIVRIDRPRIVVERWAWQPGGNRFSIAESESFEQTREEWVRITPGNL
jgi:3',5'-cyclic AMP phosphodiesterase CpdA